MFFADGQRTGSLIVVTAHLTEDRPILTEYRVLRAVLIEYRAHLTNHRALLTEYRVLRAVHFARRVVYVVGVSQSMSRSNRAFT